VEFTCEETRVEIYFNYASLVKNDVEVREAISWTLTQGVRYGLRPVNCRAKRLVVLNFITRTSQF
jgi:hypothetical protein